MLLPLGSALEAGPEHTCQHRLTGAQASMGMSAGAGATGRSLGGGQPSACLDPWLTEALSRGGAWVHWDPSSQRRPWWRWGSGWNPSRLARAWAEWGDCGLRGERACHTSWAGVCSHYCPRKLGWWAGKGSAVVAPPFMCQSTMVPCSHCGPRPSSHQHLRPSPYHQLLSPPRIHSPNPTLQHPALLPTMRHTDWGVKGCGMDCMHRLHSILPPTHWLLRSPLILRSP